MTNLEQKAMCGDYFNILNMLLCNKLVYSDKQLFISYRYGMLDTVSHGW